MGPFLGFWNSKKIVRKICALCTPPFYDPCVNRHPSMVKPTAVNLLENDTKMTKIDGCQFLVSVESKALVDIGLTFVTKSVGLNVYLTNYYWSCGSPSIFLININFLIKPNDICGSRMMDDTGRWVTNDGWRRALLSSVHTQALSWMPSMVSTSDSWRLTDVAFFVRFIPGLSGVLVESSKEG